MGNIDRTMKNLIRILIISLSMIGCAQSDDSTIDIEKIEKHIRWLVPGDGMVNGIAHRYLVKTGVPAGKLIIKYVFNF